MFLQRMQLYCRPVFHTFEADNYQVAMQFADHSEAENFRKAVQGNIEVGDFLKTGLSVCQDACMCVCVCVCVCVCLSVLFYLFSKTLSITSLLSQTISLT